MPHELLDELQLRRYLGTVELTQDIAPLRALQGERRLLQYNYKRKNDGEDQTSTLSKTPGARVLGM